MTDTVPRPDTPDTPERPNRATIARETNGHIRALARSFRDERQVGFFCECGCFGIALATLVEYDAQGGAWKDGHKPKQRRGSATV
jgi:hypothetical protein